MYAIDKCRCRLVKRQGVTGRTEATDRNILVLDTREDQNCRREIRQIIEVPETLLPDYGSAKYFDRNRYLLQGLLTTLRRDDNLFEHKRIVCLCQHSRWLQRYD